MVSTNFESWLPQSTFFAEQRLVDMTIQHLEELGLCHLVVLKILRQVLLWEVIVVEIN